MRCQLTCLSRLTWCLPTKEQGLARDEAPRPRGCPALWSGGRGAPRRRNKGWRAVRHHAPGAGRHFEAEDVVLLDEETRAGGQWGTTSPGPVGILRRRTWCLPTKEQGLARDEAPRPRTRSGKWGAGRGASRRRNKGWRAVRHHAPGPGRENGSRTWCLPTKEQGLARDEAPRPRGCPALWSGGRGACRRRNKS